MYWVSVLGTAMHTCASSRSRPPPPVRAIVCMPIRRAASTARITLVEPPLVLMPMRTSSGFPSAWT